VTAIRSALRTLAADDRGATAIEYGLIATLIGVATIASLSALGGGTDGMWTQLASSLSSSLA
jgi:pilus assembly protein Flp/PilA